MNDRGEEIRKSLNNKKKRERGKKAFKKKTTS